MLHYRLHYRKENSTYLGARSVWRWKYHWFGLFFTKHCWKPFLVLSRWVLGCSIIEVPHAIKQRCHCAFYLYLELFYFLKYWDISLDTITHCANTQWAICYTTIQPPTKVSHKNAHHLWWIKSRIVKVKLVARKEKLTTFEFDDFISYKLILFQNLTRMIHCYVIFKAGS